MKPAVVLALLAALGAAGCLTGDGGPLPRTPDAEYRVMADEACATFVRSPAPAYTGRGINAQKDRLSWVADRVSRAAPREPAPTARWRRELADPVERMERTLREAIERVHSEPVRASRQAAGEYAAFRRRYLGAARRLGLEGCLRDSARLDRQDAVFRAEARRICRQGGRRTLARLDRLAAPPRIRRLWRETLRDVPGTTQERVARGLGNPARGFRMLRLRACAHLG